MAPMELSVIIWTILVEIYYTMLLAKYLTSSLCQFREDFPLKLLGIYKETYDPTGAGLILTLEAKIKQPW
jgi:hypothetical protein